MPVSKGRASPRGRLSGIGLPAAFVLGWEQSSIIVLLPVIIDIAGLTLREIGLIIFVELAILIPAGPLWGRYSDLRGRRAGLALTTLAGLIGQLTIASTMMLADRDMLVPAQAWTCLLLGRLAFSIGAAGFMPIIQASLAGRLGAAPNSADLARVAMVLNLGRLLGPIVTSSFLLFAPSLVFWLSPILGLFALLHQRLSRHENNAPPRRHVAGRAPLWPPPRQIAGLLALSFLAVLGIRQIQFLLGPLVQLRFALTPEEAGAVTGMTLTCAALAAIATQIIVMPPLAARSRLALAIGGSGFLAGVVLMMTFGTTLQLLAGAMLSSCALACLVPTYTAMLIAKDRRAATVGLLNTAQIAGGAVGASLGGLLFTLSENLPFLLSILCATGVLALATRLHISSDNDAIAIKTHYQ